jgi:elongation factor 1 alpha-like protein
LAIPELVPLASTFSAQILVFDISQPIITGTPIELFHHSNNVPANITKLLSVMDKGSTLKKSPRRVIENSNTLRFDAYKHLCDSRVLQKGVHAQVEITLRTPSQGTVLRAPSIPLEAASANKEMGRVLLRRGGETIAAGVVTEILS